MKGIKHITISNSRVKYSFDIERNITIISGDSATGKSTLINMLEGFELEGKKSGVTLKSQIPCKVLSGTNWEMNLSKIKSSIVFIEEGNEFVSSKEFARKVKNSDNYYVIITREDLYELPYSIRSIYEFVQVRGINKLKEKFKSIDKVTTNKLHSANILLVEGSKAGYEFFQKYCLDNGKKCISSSGKTKVLSEVKRINDDDKVLIIADGAAFGAEISKVYEYILAHSNVNLYLPECFEWIILDSNILRKKKIFDILDNPSDYIESREYFSWENYFVSLLTEESKNKQGQEYSKNRLKEYYKTEKVFNKIISSIDRSLDKNKK